MVLPRNFNEFDRYPKALQSCYSLFRHLNWDDLIRCPMCNYFMQIARSHAIERTHIFGMPSYVRIQAMLHEEHRQRDAIVVPFLRFIEIDFFVGILGQEWVHGIWCLPLIHRFIEEVLHVAS